MAEATPAPEAPSSEPATPEAAKPADAAAAPAAPAAAVPESGSGPGSAAKRLFKINVEGQEEEVAEDEVTTRLQKARFHERRSQELARRMAEMEKLFGSAREKPEEGLEQIAKALGLDLDKVTEARLARELQRQIEEDEIAQLSPEQRQAYNDRKELERLRAEAKQREIDAAAAKEAEAQKALEAQYTQTLDKAMEYGMKGTKLEGDPWAQFQFASLVAQLAQEVIDGTREDLPDPKTIAAYVEQQLGRIAGRYAPPPPPAAPPPAKPEHPQARRPGRPDQPRDAKTGKFKTSSGQYGDPSFFKAEGIKVYESLATTAEKAKDAQINRFRERFGLPPKK